MPQLIDRLGGLRARLDDIERELQALRSAQGLDEDETACVTGMLLEETQRRRELEARLVEAERVAALAQLAPDAAFAGGLIDSLPMAVLIADPARRILIANEHLRRQWGDPRPYREHDDFSDVEAWWIDGRPVQPHEWPIARAFITGEPQAPVEMRLRREDGSIGVAVMSAAPVRDAAGAIAFAVAVSQDITEQRRAEEKLHLHHELLRHIGDSTPDMIFAKDLHSRLLYANRAALETTGKDWEDLAGLSDEDWCSNSEAAHAFMDADARVIASGRTEVFEEAVPGPDGPRTVLMAKSPLRDASGRVLGVIGVGKDITDRKRAEERSVMLAQELGHRAKNTLAVVLSIARHSLTAAGAPAAACTTFEQRIMAMARAHDVLTRREWTGAEVSELTAGAMSPYASHGDGVTLEGPKAMLSAHTALGLSIALHELATNAAKYGGLSRPGGEVRLAWDFEPDSDRLKMVWEEHGGPPVQPPAAHGFGSRLIRRALAHDREAMVEVLYPPSGVRCELCFRAEPVEPA